MYVSTYLVVVHERVEGLDPHGVDVAIQDDPLGSVASHVGLVAHQAGEKA